MRSSRKTTKPDVEKPISANEETFNARLRRQQFGQKED